MIPEVTNGLKAVDRDVSPGGCEEALMCEVCQAVLCVDVIR